MATCGSWTCREARHPGSLCPGARHGPRGDGAGRRRDRRPGAGRGERRPVGTSYRGGRLGQESFIIDGLQVKNQLDASTGGLGLRVPVDMLTEGALTTNGFSARYGQALSGLVNVVTREGGERWSGRAAYETDRPAPDGADYGLDRFVLAGDGPLPGGLGLAAAAGVLGRLDADPVDAPGPVGPHDP